MRKVLFYACAILLMAFLFNCGEDTSTDMAEAPKNRNVFGFNLTRGLTKSAESLPPVYIMFACPNSPFNYLLNRQGQVVHQWKGNYSSFNAYLQEDGSIFNGTMDPDYPVFGFGGPYGRIEKISWDGKILWDYELANEQEILHHDFEVMPNGHILAIVYEATPLDTVLAMGREAEKIPQSGAWLEKIIEVVPNGPRGGDIVWEWRLKDHIIQGRDEKLANYGDPGSHPELLDFNLGNPAPPPMHPDSLAALRAKDMAERNQTINNMGADIFHFNAIDYNPELDQIVFSSPILSEIYIIDHSTSTEEAAGHTGGKSGMGGDLIYRWGNPENYQAGDSTARKLFGQHDVRWIEKGKPGGGHLTVFNNHPPGEISFDSFEALNTGNNYSMVFEIATPVDSEGGYPFENGQSFGPGEPFWFYRAPDTLSFYGPFISGAHRMENGNTFVCEGPRGRFFEVTPEGEMVWEYLNPFRGDIRKPNGDPNNPMFMPFSTFRATFVPADHPALEGKELKPIDPQPEPFKMPPMPTAMAGDH